MDDVDFPMFAVQYDVFGCMDGAMPAGCPSDFNGDGVVDDTDFVVFAMAYESFNCP